MNLLQLVDERDEKIKKMKTFTDKVKEEKRKMNETETLAFGKMSADVEALNKTIGDIKEQDKRSTPITKNKTNTMENYKLMEQIRDARNGDTFRMVAEERADITAGSTNSGEEFISEDKVGLIEPLRDALVLVKAGATFLTGLKGDVSIPSYAGTSSSWKGETTIAVDGAGATSEVTMSPKRLTCFIDVSKQFLIQDTVGAEAMLLKDIVDSVATKLEGTILSGAIASSTQPAGLFSSALTNYGASSWSNVVALETAITANNISYDSAAYITSAKGAGYLKSKAKSSNAALFILENNETNGYPVLVTNAVIDTISGVTGSYTGGTESGIVFADWSQFVIGQWGTIDLTVDTVTQATYGNVRLVVNAYFDAVKRRSGAFAVGSILS